MIKEPTQKTRNTSVSGPLYMTNGVLLLNDEEEIKTILKILKLWT